MKSSTAPRQDEPKFGLTNLRTKIAIGFGVVLLMHVSVAILAHFGLGQARETLDRYAEASNQTVRILEIDRDLIELQRKVLLFTYTGQAGVAEQVKEAQRDLTARIAEIRERSRDEQRRRVLDGMSSALEDYAVQFEEVIITRRERNEVVVDGLRAEAELADDQILELIAATDSVELTNRLQSVEVKLLRAKKLLNRYLDDLNGISIDQAVEQLDGATETIESCRGEFNEPRSAQLMEDLAVAFPRLRASMNFVVQSTRGYLHLVNVVMAGLALELTNNSADFRTQVVDDLGGRHDRMLAEQERFRWMSGVFSILTMLIGIFAAVAISRSLTRPIDAMTTTFTRLSRGEDAPIPGVDRVDEIGEMANAAAVFKRKNAETRELLDRQRELARAYEFAIEDLERSNRDLDNFAYVASHDLKAPLRAISSLAEWIEEDASEALSGKTSEYFAMLQQRVRRMEKLLDDLLRYSRAGRGDYESERTDALELARDVVQLVGPPTGFDVSVTGESAEIDTPRVLLEQVLGNLISNAIKHHDRDEGHVVVDVADGPEFAVITVTDDGPGIAEKHHDRIFKVFQTLKSRDEVEASGMGLAIVRRIAERQGASITLNSSSAARGATFRIKWPKNCVTRSEE